MMNRNPFLLIPIIIVALAGCATQSNYTKPDAPIPAQWPTGSAYAETAATTDAVSVTEMTWQDFIADESLRQIIDLALANNRDLRLTALNVERAQAMYGIQKGELLPTVEATGIRTEQRTAAGVFQSQQAVTVRQSSVNIGITAWELDLFGRIRNLTESALEQYFASEEAHRSTQIILIAEVAKAFYRLAADQEDLQLAKSTLATQEETLKIVKSRFEGGLSPELDVQQAKTRVDAAKVDVALYTRLVAQDDNALNLLAGVPVPANMLPADLDAVTPPQDIQPGISSAVLLARPDILQAEHQLKAANANLNAARVAFFPRISLTSAVGTASQDLSGLFSAGSAAWNWAPKIVMPIFDSRVWFGLKATKVERQISLTQYEKAIQTAFREVADALAVHGTIDQQLEAQQSLIQSVSETYRLSNLRYKKGVDNYLSVLDAQRSLYTAQQGLVAVRWTKLASQVQLYTVLGGGFPTPNTQS